MKKIIWISSYPKSGNTFLRSLLVSYFFSKKGDFDQKDLSNISEFPRDYSNFVKEDDFLNEFLNWENQQKRISENCEQMTFLKTHLANIKIKENYYSINPKFTLCSIYIVRDPRNVILSLKDHFQISISESEKFLFNEKKVLNMKKENLLKGFTPILDWGSNYKSWNKKNLERNLTIKYEDLVLKTEETFKKVLKHIIKYTKFEINEKKFTNTIDTTKFNNVRKIEQNFGFIEKKIMGIEKNPNLFFNKGINRDYKKNENDKQVFSNIEKKYFDIMTQLNYL